MVAPHLDPHEVARELASLNVVAELDWYPATPHLLGLNILQNRAGGVAALDRADALYRVGATNAEVVRHLARHFQADVHIGDQSANDIPASVTFPEVGTDSPTLRAVEITSMPAASVPFCAAAEGRSLGVRELDNGQRTVFYELPDEDFVMGAMVTMTPAVGFFVSPEDAKLVAVLEQGEAAPESLAVHSWTMRTLVIAGAVTSGDPQLEQRVRADLGHRENPRRVAGIVTDADAEGLETAFAMTGREGVLAALQALGVPAELASFLYGHVDLEDVPGADVHHKPGWRDALGSHVDILMGNNGVEEPAFLSLYRRTYLERPWLGRGLALGEAAIGAALTVVAARAGTQRNAWHKIGGTLGAALLADSVAEVTMATYLGQRLRRYRDAHDATE
ncbi:hypothetical protein [Nanchangia anserum]|uniref:Uncharacterized protein n=2 Tax=Nanchangia anserum TaxID=2692125 RepID=A0A8I0GBC9_9ACTO|nr:hypothetical protein [Nanchangia anserum]MBD3689161.1 hypothetical protein [Nanchangia anserum]